MSSAVPLSALEQAVINNPSLMGSFSPTVQQQLLQAYPNLPSLMQASGTTRQSGVTVTAPTPASTATSNAALAKGGTAPTAVQGATANANNGINQYDNRPVANLNNNPNFPVPLPYGYPPGGWVSSYENSVDGANLYYQTPPPNSTQLPLTQQAYNDYTKAPPVVQAAVQNGTVNPTTLSQGIFNYVNNVGTGTVPLPTSPIAGQYTATTDPTTGQTTYSQVSSTNPVTGQTQAATGSATGNAGATNAAGGTNGSANTGTQNPDAATNFNNTQSAAYQQALTQLGQGALQTQLNTTNVNADRANTLQSIGAIQNLAQGNFGSNDPATIALQQAGQGALRNMQSATADAAASSSPNLAYSNLLNSQGALQSQLAQQGALARANEQLSAMNALPGLNQALQTSDLGTATAQAGI